MPPPSSSPTDELQALRAQLAAMKGELRVVTVERDLLREKLKAYQRQLFAAKSEVRGAEQRDLFLNEAEAAATGCEPAQETETEQSIEVGAHERKKRGRKPLDPMLPREIVRHELPDSERVCAHDGHALVEIGAEISEQLDIVPQQVRVIQHQRIKYACPCCDLGIKVTPAPARIIPKGLLTESALAWVVVSKFADALPLYRIAALLHRFGGDLSRGTLAASVVRVGTAVQPLINLMRDHLLEADIVYGDETTVQVLKEPGRAAQRKSYMWVQMSGTGPPVRLFSYSPTRSTAQAAVLYAGIKPGAVLILGSRSRRNTRHQAANSNSSSASPGVFHPSVLRGRQFSALATASSSRSEYRLMSVPFGKYCRRRPLVFSSVPRCHGLCGSQK